jgi:cell filamentation protein, protein adenylyltransferase
MMFEPCPFQLTAQLANLLAAIAEAVGKLSAVTLAKPDPKLRRKNRIRTIQASLAIEGNTLTSEQVAALLDKKRVIGPKQDILEVQNAAEVYNRIGEFNPFSLPAFLEAHRILMQGLVVAPGKLRLSPIGVLREKDIFHEAPEWKKVAPMMADLFEYLKSGNDHILFKSCRCHYQLEYIHPFIDGNGRMGRLWQTRLLMQYHPVFEFLPAEHLIHERQADYYRSLAKGDETGDCTDFIAFVLEQLHRSLEQLLDDTRSVTLTADDRLEFARSVFGAGEFSRKDFQSCIKNISSATASRDLQHGVEIGLLQRSGDKRTAVYMFVMNR